MDEADKIVRYCPECGHIGAINPPALTCCPDFCGMSMKRWQAEKLERVLDRARGQRRSPPSAPRAEAVEARRYRALRDRQGPSPINVSDGNNPLYGDALDSAIDAAIAQGADEGERNA